MNRWVAYFSISVLASGSLAPAVGQTHFNTIYNFANGYPTGLTLVNGGLFGTFEGLGGTGAYCGEVFSLRPPTGAPGGGQWGETVLYSFGSAADACDPTFPPLAGSGGVFYGVSYEGGSSDWGALYELQPPTSFGGTWTENVLYSLSAPPASNLVRGPGGSFYVLDQGGAYGAGALLQLIPPSSAGGAWTATQLFSFGGGHLASTPNYLIPGPNGSLYGTSTYGGDTRSQFGTVFQLIPPTGPGDAWTEVLLHSFGGENGNAGNPNSLVQNSDGTLFGTTYGFGFGFGNGAGVVFQLKPPASQGGEWTYTILKNFGALHPDSPIILHNGVLYSALETTTGGEVFALEPPATAGAEWTLVFLHNYTDGQVPFGPMVMSQQGTLYGATGTINAPFSGTVYQIETQ